MGKNLQKKPKSQMSDEERVRDFQRNIYLKAKQEKNFRFYVLYDKVRAMRFLRVAYKRVKAKKGKPGLDGVTFQEIEKYGVEKYLRGIRKELEEKTYRPSPVLRVYIPKANGKKRPLGIPVIKDRIIQMSCKLVIEPIFEADFEDNSYGFRPKRSAHDAVRAIKEQLKSGKTELYDADLSAYFDTIPHGKLMILLGKRISDKNVLRLIKMWLKTPVNDNGRMTGGKRNKVGTPQGGVISPLLANIYLNLLDKIVSKCTGMFYRMGVSIVRYADDFVLMGSRITTGSIKALNKLLDRMELRLNAEKSSHIRAEKESFDFLGFTFRYDKDIFGRRTRYWNVIPSKNSCIRVRSKIRDFLKKSGHRAPKDVADGLNLIVRGWLNYFTISGISYPRMAQRNLRYYLFCKLRRFYKRKSQRKSRLYRRRAFEVLVRKYGMIEPTNYSTV